jgi:DNA-3-methyladenine glycosylase II
VSPRPSAGTRTAPPAGSAKGIRHLRKVDPVIGAIVEAHGPLDQERRRRGRPADAYGALLRSIVGQQLSTKAARTIYGRLADLYGGRAPTPAELIDTHPDRLREAGLSRAKASYLRSLAEHVVGGELELDRLNELSDDEVSAQLTAVKGLGQWTADMFLIFHLERPDVLPVGDLGVRRAVQIAYELEGLPKPAELLAIGEPWRPHRSLASLYLWSSLDNEPG